MKNIFKNKKEALQFSEIYQKWRDTYQEAALLFIPKILPDHEKKELNVKRSALWKEEALLYNQLRTYLKQIPNKHFIKLPILRKMAKKFGVTGPSYNNFWY